GDPTAHDLELNAEKELLRVGLQDDSRGRFRGRQITKRLRQRPLEAGMEVRFWLLDSEDSRAAQGLTPRQGQSGQDGEDLDHPFSRIREIDVESRLLQVSERQANPAGRDF